MRAKRLVFAFTIYLAVTVIGSFSFSTAEGFRFFDSMDNLKNSGGFFTTVSRAIDCLAEDTVTIGKTNAPSFSPRSWWLRTFIPAGNKNSGMYYSETALLSVNEDHVPNSKNTIQINLRI